MIRLLPSARTTSLSRTSRSETIDFAALIYAHPPRQQKNMEINKVKIPILTILNRIAALIAFLVAIGVFVTGIIEQQQPMAVAITTGVSILYGLFAWGIAEVIHLIAKIEYNTRNHDGTYQTVKLLTKIAKNTDPQS